RFDQSKPLTAASACHQRRQSLGQEPVEQGESSDLKKPDEFDKNSIVQRPFSPVRDADRAGVLLCGGCDGAHYAASGVSELPGRDRASGGCEPISEARTAR